MESTTKRLRRREASSEFPPEIFTEILLRLPTRSIGRSRCVSKLFCSLSSDLGFIKRHIDKNAGNPKLLLSSRNLYTVDLGSVVEGSRELVGFELDYPLKDEPSYLAQLFRNNASELFARGMNLELVKRNRVEIIGSSNGLVCIYPERGGTFLFNPTTGESKKVPESVTNKQEPYGFGYDNVSQDYKVVKFVANGDDCKDYHNVDVYSLKSASWRRVQGHRYKHVAHYPGVYLNGAIHWVAKLEKGQNKKRMVVAAFDLETEKFRDIQLPDDASDYWFLRAVNLKGHLCLVFSCDFQKRDVMWVMNEYGSERSWSKIQLSMFYSSITPLWSSSKNDEEVLLELERKLVLYNFKLKTMRSLEINCETRTTLAAYLCRESHITQLVW